MRQRKKTVVTLKKLLWSLKLRQIYSVLLVTRKSCSIKKRCKTSCNQAEIELDQPLRFSHWCMHIELYKKLQY